ncbi:hypothetical protein [Tumebacillus permanentifrigoris]|uniref:Peptidase MA-like domain-containing protein n=1 Tax=Tumebacillus permanentifrigoris TaxID=378543 RepID=A0A316DBF1_9BACL|nr:hypothetical protein [Tumebacillus permanentifrigoris]PWK14925.1 hypothetical protein C7459_104127 [Tumebacillus permanentifrigoris]
MFRRGRLFLVVLCFAMIALTGCDLPLTSKPDNFIAYELVKGDDAVTDDQQAQVQRLLEDGNLLQKVGSEYGFTYQETIRVQLASGDDGYRSLLTREGKSSETLDNEVKYTDASVYRSNITINLAKRKTDGELSSTLAHELTHILFNQNALRVPSWINEGLAQRMGFAEDARDQSPLMKKSERLKVYSHVLKNKQEQGHLELLVDNLETIHTMTSTYNVEWLDYLAVQCLWDQQGAEKFRQYLQKIKDNPLNKIDPFEESFGVKQTDYESTFNQRLAGDLAHPDKGVTISYTLHEDSPGKLLIRQAGAEEYNILALEQGSHQLTVLPDNTVTGLPVARMVKGKSEVRPNVLFFIVSLDKPEEIEGQMVKTYGFAIARYFGRYYYMNSFLNTEDGASSTHHDLKLPSLELTGLEVPS